MVPNTAEEVPELLTAAEVAPMLRRSAKTVLELWRTGELAGYRLGRRGIRFTRADVAAYLADRRVEAAR